VIADRDGGRVLGYRVLEPAEVRALAAERMARAHDAFKAGRHVPAAQELAIHVLRVAQHDYHDPRGLWPRGRL